jgi:hypothetical protein
MKKLRWPLSFFLVFVCIVVLWRWKGCGSVGTNGTSAGTGLADSNYFTITVAGSTIRVHDRNATAVEAVQLAKEDGRPLLVIWDKAMTDAENALKAELLRRGVTLASERTLR